MHQIPAVDLVRHATGECFVQHHTDRVQIAAHIDLVRPIELLGGHVGHSANQVSRGAAHARCARRRLRDGRLACFGALDESCYTEVNDLRLPLSCYQHIARLEIAMQDAAGVCMAQRFDDLHEQPHHALPADVLRTDIGHQRLTRDKLHDEVGPPQSPYRIGARVIDARNVRVFEPA